MEFISEVNESSKVTPRYLYIYMGIENVVKTLKNKGIYLSKATNFNDPFEELYTVLHIGSKTYKTWVTFQQIIEFYLTNAEYIENYWGRIDFDFVKTELAKQNYDWIITIENAVNEFIKISKFDKIAPTTVISHIEALRRRTKANFQDNTIKIACFSDTHESIPMWAYYGKNHKGCCIRFDLHLLTDEDIKQNIFSISYCANRDIENVHYSKSIGWMHESEWRLMLRNYDEDYLPFDCITAIYFGINNDLSDTSSEKFIWHNVNSFVSKQYTHYGELITLIEKSAHPIELYSATPDLENYKIQFEKYL